MSQGTVTCASCGHENRAGARFCQRCGKALQAADSGQMAARGRTKPLRRPPSSQDLASLPETRPLDGVSDAFRPLPEGAILGQGQYLIVEERSTDEEQATYLVEAFSLVRVCPNCQTTTRNQKERFCSHCGADLSGVDPVRPRFLAHESADQGRFAAEARLVKMELEHPSLLLPHDVFAESPYGPPRHYLIEPASRPPLARTLPVPQEVRRVVAWGVSLAHGLAYLHRHDVTLRQAGLDHMAVEGETALWTRLHGTQVGPSPGRSTLADDAAANVRELAGALYTLATGRKAYAADAGLPAEVSAVFDEALGSPRRITEAGELGARLKAALVELRRPTRVTLVSGHSTDVGRERSVNEDSLLALDMAPVYRSTSTPIGLFAVADGMGGHDAGDVASQLTIRTVAQMAIAETLAPSAAGEPLPEAGEWLTNAVQAANEAVHEERQSAGSDMGSTLVMALLVGDEATLANVGDSRAYLLDEEGIQQITTDHSLVARLVETGQITAEEARTHPQRNVVYRVIGDQTRLEVDLYERRLGPDEALLLCSDGLSGMVSDETIWQTWRTSTSPQEACDRLVAAANRAGGQDNIAAVIVALRR